MSKPKKTILYITELFPYPPISGGTIKTFNTIQTLSNKFNIVLICINKDYPKIEFITEIKKYVKSVTVFEAKNIEKSPQSNLLELFVNYYHFKPYFLYHAYSNDAKEYIHKILSKNEIDVIHFDHVSMAQYLPVTSLWIKFKKIIFDFFQDSVLESKVTLILEEHNIEYLLAWTKFTSFKEWKRTKIFLFFEFVFIYLFEKTVYKKFDHVFAISTLDKEIIEKEFENFNTSVQQVVLPLPHTKKILKKNLSKKDNIRNAKKGKSILFVGDITWDPNKFAIKWFIETVFPHILKKEPSVIFNIVGKIDNDFYQEIYKKNNVKIYGFQQDIQKFYARASIFILPFLSGGGVRIKALEASLYKLPIVSTKIGIQGIELANLQEVFIANSPRKFACFCLLLIRNEKIAQKLAKNAHLFVTKNNSIKNNIIFSKKYEQLISKI